MRFAINGRLSGQAQARVYEWKDREWRQLGYDIVGEAPGDESGWSVAISSDGERVIVGAPYNKGNGSNGGHARVYGWKDSDWRQLGNDIDGEAAGDESGWSVAISGDGDRVIVGAPYNNGNGRDAGHSRVYERKYGDNDKNSNNNKDNDADQVIVGAPYNDGNGSETGRAHVFEWKDGDNDNNGNNNKDNDSDRDNNNENNNSNSNNNKNNYNNNKHANKKINNNKDKKKKKDNVNKNCITI